MANESTDLGIRIKATGGKEAADREIRPMKEASDETTSSLELMAAAARLLAESPESLKAMKEASAQLADASRTMREEMEASGETAERTAAALAPIEGLLNDITDAIVAREEAEAAETARLQAEAYEAEAAALRELEAAYDAAQVAAAEALAAEAAKAEAQAEAARRTEAGLIAMTEAVGDAADALDGMADRGDAGAESVAAFGDQIRDLEAALREAGRTEEEVAVATEHLRRTFDAATDAMAEATVAAEEQQEEEEAGTAATERKREALGKMHSALDKLIPGYGRVRQQVNALREAWRASAAEGRSFGGRLVAMAGGPVGIGIAAFTALVGVVVKWRQTLADARSTADRVLSSDDLAEKVGKQKTAFSEAATEAGKYSGALKKVAEEMEARKAAWQGEIDRANELAEAQRLAAKAAIDLAVARGEMSSEEGAARKGELEIDALRRELATVQIKAANDKAVADAEFRRAKEMERYAAEAVKAAEKEAQEAGQRAERLEVEARTRAMRAAMIGDLGIFDASAGKRAVDLAGGLDEVRRLAEEMKGLAGWNVRTSLSNGLSPEQALGGPLERSELARVMAESAEAEKVAAEASRAAAKEQANKVAEERRKELDAVRTIREAREKEAEAAKAALDDAVRRRQLGLDYRIPAMESGIEASRLQGQQRQDRERQDAYDRAKKDLDGGVLGVAKQIGEMVASRGPGAEDSETGRLLVHIRKMLEDGSDYNETATVAEMLRALSTSLEISEAVRAELVGAHREIQRLNSGFRLLRDQIRNNPNRG